jgi:hypothetical protein
MKPLLFILTLLAIKVQKLLFVLLSACETMLSPTISLFLGLFYCAFFLSLTNAFYIFNQLLQHEPYIFRITMKILS